jgi:hypothetical protein
MKALFLLLLSSVAVSAWAQLTDGERKKITEKNLRLLQEAPFSKTKQPVVIVTIPETVFLLKQDQMPCVVPDVKAITPIPNALPQFTIPDLTAIPNSALPKDLQAPVILHAPGSK